MRKSTSQSETIRQPRGLAPDSESALEETLTENELTSETFTGWHVGIVFYPGTTDGVEFPFEDFGLNALEQLRVELFKPLVLLFACEGKYRIAGVLQNTYLSRATSEPVLGVPFHEVDLGRPRPGDFLLCSTEGLHAPRLVPPEEKTMENTNPEPGIG